MNFNLVSAEEFKKLEDKIDKILSAISIKNHHQSNNTYTNKDVCQRLNICSKTLQYYRKSGMIEYSQTGRKIHYQESQVQKFLENHKVKTNYKF